MCTNHTIIFYILAKKIKRMSFKQEFNIDKLLPGQSIDCVIIGYDLEELYILVLKWKETDNWSLPGGFIYIDEDMDSAAVRILKDRTGLEMLFLDQFHTFGNKDRRSKNNLTNSLEIINRNKELMQWFKQRFISTGYLSLVNIDRCNPKPDVFSDACEWKPVNKLPKLIFDHDAIVKKALEHIRIHLNYLPVFISLLPEKFTMKALQKLYESILQKKLDRGNFQKKMLKMGVFIRLEKQLDGGAHKAPYLYKLDKEKYRDLNTKDIGIFS